MTNNLRQRRADVKADPPPSDAPPTVEDLAELRGAQSPLPAGLIAVISFAGLAVTLFLAAFGTQMLVAYAQIAVLPGWLQPIAYGLLAFLSLAVLAFVISAATSYFRLRASPKLELSLYRGARDGADASDEAWLEHLRDGRRVLARHMRGYDLKAGRRNALRPLGLDLERAEAARERLLSDTVAGDQEWLQRFDQDFLKLLDEAAGRRIRAGAKVVLVTTAFSPRGAIDTIAVLFASYQLVRDLCVIYRLRAGRLETGFVLLHAIFNLAAASQLDELADSSADVVSDIGEVSSLVGLSVFGRVAGPVQDGLANALLLWRLGARTQAYLRPIRKEQVNVVAAFVGWARNLGLERLRPTMPSVLGRRRREDSDL